MELRVWMLPSQLADQPIERKCLSRKAGVQEDAPIPLGGSTWPGCTDVLGCILFSASDGFWGEAWTSTSETRRQGAGGLFSSASLVCLSGGPRAVGMVGGL